LHLCPSDRRTSSLGVGLSGRQHRSVVVVLLVVSSLLHHCTSSILAISDIININKRSEMETKAF